MYGLTQNQLQAYDIICRKYEKNKVPPSYQELMEEMGLRSKSGIHRIIQALKNRGYIEDIPNCARSMRPTMKSSHVRSEGDVMKKVNDLAWSAHFGEVPAIDAINRIIRLTASRST